MRIDGELTTAVSTDVNNGGKVFFMLRPHHFLVVVDQPQWRLTPGAEVNMTIQLEDGASFSGRATAVEPRELAIDNSDAELMKALMAGQKVSLELGGARWDLSLDGFAASLNEASTAYARAATKT